MRPQGCAKDTRDQDANFSKRNLKNDMLSILHAKDAFWNSLFFKIFLAYHNCCFRRKVGDKIKKKVPQFTEN